MTGGRWAASTCGRTTSRRASAAWIRSARGKTSVRGGYGIFYSNTMFNVALLANWLGLQRSS
jgi:hypothetical protein